MGQMDEVAKKVGIQITASAETSSAVENAVKALRTFKDVCKDAAKTAKDEMKGMPAPMIAFLAIVDKGGPKVQEFFDKMLKGGKTSAEALKATVMKFQELIPLAKETGEVADKGMGGIARGTRIADIALGEYAATWFFLKRAITDVISGINQAIELAATGTRAEDLVRGFNQLAVNFHQNAAAITADMIDLSHDTVNQYQAAQLAALALMMTEGKIGDRTGELMQIARAEALLTGRTINDVYTTIARNMASGYSLGLRRLGLMVDFKKAYDEYADSIGIASDELSEEEKLQVRVNEVLARGNQIVKDMGGEVDFASDVYNELSASTAEARIEMGKFFDLAMSPAIQDYLVPAIKHATAMMQVWTEADSNMAFQWTQQQRILMDMTGSYDEYLDLLDRLQWAVPALTEEQWNQVEAGTATGQIVMENIEVYRAFAGQVAVVTQALSENAQMAQASDEMAASLEEQYQRLSITAEKMGISLEGISGAAYQVVLDMTQSGRSLTTFLRQFPHLADEFGEIPKRIWDLYNKQTELGLSQANELATWITAHPAQYSAMIALSREEEQEQKEAERKHATWLQTQIGLIRQYPQIAETFVNMSSNIWDMFTHQSELSLEQVVELATWVETHPMEATAMTVMVKQQEQAARDSEQANQNFLRQQQMFLQRFPQLVGEFGDIPERMWDLYIKQTELGMAEAQELTAWIEEHPGEYVALVALAKQEEQAQKDSEQAHEDFLREQEAFLRMFPHLVSEFGGIPGRMWDLYNLSTQIGLADAQELATWAAENPGQYSAMITLANEEETAAREAARAHESWVREQEQAAREMERIQTDMSNALRAGLGLEETDVTWLDVQLTYVGDYVEKWDEYARRLRAAVIPGNMWESMIPEAVRGKGEGARQQWVDEQLKVFYAGLMPEEIDWAAIQKGIITTVQRTAQFAGSAWEKYMPAEVVAGSPEVRRQWVSKFFASIFAGENVPGAVDWTAIKQNIMNTFGQFDIELGPDALFQGELLAGHMSGGFNLGLEQADVGEEVKHRLRQDIRDNEDLGADVFETGAELGAKIIQGIAEEIEGATFHIGVELGMVDVTLVLADITRRIQEDKRATGNQEFGGPVE